MFLGGKSEMDNDRRIDMRLRQIAKELDITDEKYENAVSSYKAVGTYLSNNIDTQVEIFPQGSFKLGTVIKPLSDEDDYDIDLVCKVKKFFSKPQDLKNEVGQALKLSDRYSKMLQEEGKRCWTLKYADKAQYHMDILPAIEDITYCSNKKLKITNKDENTNIYTFTTTTPEAYFEWFDKKQKEEKRRLLESFAFQNNKNIAEVPDYKVRTTLQVALQILKRYRDKKFEKNLEDKPISIILTTIMAQVYKGENNVYELIKNFSNNYHKYIKIKDGIEWVENPVNNDENFADKWQIYPERKDAFGFFISELKRDIVNNTFIASGDLLKESKSYKELFGEKIVEKAYANIGNKAKILRESGKMYIDRDATVNFKQQGTKVKDHKFFGQEISKE